MVVLNGTPVSSSIFLVPVLSNVIINSASVESLFNAVMSHLMMLSAETNGVFEEKSHLYVDISFLYHRWKLLKGKIRILGLHYPKGLERAWFDNQYYGNWNEIGINEIATAIFELYKNYPVYREKAIKGASWIEERWRNEDMEDRVRAILRFIAKEY